jgi:hypothetical protein
MITHDMRLECDTTGCLNHAAYWCVWGCYDLHVHDAKFCLPCMTAKKSKVVVVDDVTAVRLICYCGLFIKMFFYTSVTDGKRTLMGDLR